MKRTTCFILCLSLTLLVTHDTQARKKRKKGEPVISKRGKLIFEDDFSGKELEWVQAQGEWKLVKKMLVPKSCAKGKRYAIVDRPIDRGANLIIQMRVLLAQDAYVVVSGRERNSVDSPSVAIRTSGSLMSFLYLDQDGKTAHAAQRVIQYPKPRWLLLCFEMLDRRRAFTVDGKTIKHESTKDDVPPSDRVRIHLGNFGTAPCAIDDVKVWEALPKDEEDEKGKKKRKRR